MNAPIEAAGRGPSTAEVAPWWSPQHYVVWATLAFFFAALAVRLHWNLSVHPLGDYIYSDMRGYMDRADGIFDEGWAVREYNAFYPYGTHVLLYGIQRVFGRGNHAAIGAVYAVLGAVVVAYGHILACLVSRRLAVRLLTGACLVTYYPLISLGGYFLSEVPFALCITAATAHLLGLVRGGKAYHAWLVGTFVALGFTLRPQILASCVVIGVLWLVLRKSTMAKVRLAHWLQAFVPILAIMVFSAWRLHYHTERYGLISENGKFNQVYGRCHVKKITAHPDLPTRRRTSFGPPAMIQLESRGRRDKHAWPQLDPALDIHFEYKGYIGDSEILGAYIDRCVAKVGWRKQVEYAVVDVLLLWRFNTMWPDSGKAEWQPVAHKWGLFVQNVLALPCILAMFAIFRPRRFTPLALLSAHLWGLHAVAAIYLGGVRFRAPYDVFVIIMALEIYVGVAWLAVAAVGRLRRGRGAAPPSPAD